MENELIVASRSFFVENEFIDWEKKNKVIGVMMKILSLK